MEEQNGETREVVDGQVTEAAIGARIRARRRQQEMTLDQLSERSGLAKSYLSQVERGVSSPSLGSLRSIAEALEVPMLAFFMPDAGERVAVIRAGERRTLTHPGSCVRLEILVPDLHHDLEVVVMHIPPGHDSSVESARHRGDECFIMVEGSAELVLDTQTVALEAGDCAYILAHQRHLVRNTGERDVIAIIALTPPSI